MATRTTQEVFEDHLKLRREGDLETDLERNFAEDCVLLTSFGVFPGRRGAREAAELRAQQLPNARFVYRTRLYQGEVAFLEWEADADGTRVEDGADSFLIRDGVIKVMTVHYTPQPK